MLTEVGIRTTPRMWDPGPAWNKFFQAEGKATAGRRTAPGATTRSSTPTRCCTRSTTTSRAAGSASGTRAWRGSTSSSTRRARRWTSPSASALYSQIQQMIREEAPSIFLWTQYDTLGISKKVQYAARPDEWLWLYDAKPAAR